MRGFQERDYVKVDVDSGGEKNLLMIYSIKDPSSTYHSYRLVMGVCILLGCDRLSWVDS